MREESNKQFTVIEHPLDNKHRIMLYPSCAVEVRK